MSYFVYVLYSAGIGRYYIGSTANVDVRLAAHNAGRVRSTKSGRPWMRIWEEALPDRAAARRRERYLKSGWGRRWLKKRLATEGWQSG